MYESDDSREREIENAKRAIVVKRERKWRREWALENQKPDEYIEDAIARAPVPPDLTPIWVVHTWDTGFLVMDTNDYNKIPKKKRNKFEKSIR